MIWFFERHDSRLLYEIRRQADGDDYELVVTFPDGRQEVEHFADPHALIERSERLQEALRAQGLGFLLHENRLRENWEKILGAKAAEIAKLESLKDFVLSIKVDEAVWRNELHYQREAIRQKANGILGAEIVREVRLR